MSGNCSGKGETEKMEGLSIGGFAISRLEHSGEYEVCMGKNEFDYCDIWEVMG